MRILRSLMPVMLLSLAALPGLAAHTEARLFLEADEARPGETVIAGIELKMDVGWHTYWKNPGASGMPTSIKWTLPAGLTAGEIQWPPPEKLPEEDLTTYIYQGETMLLVPLKLAAELKPGKLEIRAKVSWLECEVMCLPGDSDVSAVLEIGVTRKESRNSNLITAWQKRLPQSADQLSPLVQWDSPALPGSNSRAFIIQWTPPHPFAEADFFPYADDAFEIEGPTERLTLETKVVALRKKLKKLSGDWPAEISGLILQKEGDARESFEVKQKLAPLIGTKSPASEAIRPTAGGVALSFWKAALYAFIGGLILNIMPCVLPVIALKILGFVNQARDHPARIRKLGLIYALGVLTSFLSLALLVVALQAAGKTAGWGMQFGNPQFLVGLTILMTLVALNLFGLFEIVPGSGVMDAAGNLASKEGTAGAFFNGVLATILATPCTAPFLGVALGFAFAQTSALLIIAIFLVAGAGLASPYVLLSWKPAWLKFLPKPGLWMEHFKVSMGFPMLATAVWLFSLTLVHYGARTWWLALFLVIVALAAWVFGTFIQRGTRNRVLAGIVAVSLLAGGFLCVVEGQLNWRHPEGGSSSGTSIKNNPGGIAWEPWSLEAIAKAQAENRPVFVDFTADWCLTCQANKKFAIEIPSVRARLKEINALPLLGDYTRLPKDITAELRKFGRAGVPLVLVYPRDPKAEPIVLPEALTPGIVLEALGKAR